MFDNFRSFSSSAKITLLFNVIQFSLMIVHDKCRVKVENHWSADGNAIFN